MEMRLMTKPIDAITTRCRAALSPEVDDQSMIYSTSAKHGTFAFEFRWTDGRLYKVVVSEAEDVGVENMVYPPGRKARP
jgi:hypothetical protein